MGEAGSGTSVTIVNRLYPPLPGITGESANELAAYLRDEHEMDVNVVHVDGKYFGKATSTEPVGRVRTVKTIYHGRRKLLRLFGNLIEGYRLMRAARKINASHTIVMTDPPLLPMWASMFMRGKKWTLWTMDIFPQAFVANNLVTEKNPLYKSIRQWTFKNAPNEILALGPGQKAYVCEAFDVERDGILLPCGIYADDNHSSDKPDWRNDDDKIYFGYAGNLGEAHSPEFIEACMDRLDPAKHRMILSTYGRHGDRIRDIGKGHPAVEVVDFVHRHHLKYIDVHLVTLLEQWTHVCVPSKAVSAVCAGSTFIFCGAQSCDIWQLLQDAGWYVDHGNTMLDDVDRVWSEVTRERVAEKRNRATTIAAELLELRAKAFSDVASTIENS